MRKRFLRGLCAVLCAAALLGCLPAGATDDGIRFLSYEEALTYFDFDRAASNWCSAFGWDPMTRLWDAREAILRGTDPQLIIRLATFARDTGHGGEKLTVTNAFRPACYQEIIGLHDSNGYTGPYRNAMLWNGRSVTGFWWTAESAPGWPEDYAIDLSRYDLQTLDLRFFYREALRLWDNTWVSNYYARPGCSAHNSGTAIDLGNYWIATNFSTVYSFNGKDYDMADYGLYKPLQPTETSAGEAWHITSSPAVLALGNYDSALLSGYEVVYGVYYNPSTRGWSMEAGRSLYMGAGVAVIQVRLCQMGLLEEKYITGYCDTKTEAAIRAFQSSLGLEADGICGAGTLERLFPDARPSNDDTPPVLRTAAVTWAGSRSFTLQVIGEDETLLSAFRVETRREDAEDDVWVCRSYNAPKGGSAALDIDIWQEGIYEVRAAARDAAGNESELLSAGSIFIDTTPPVFRELAIRNITETGFDLYASAEDNGMLLGFTVTLTSEDGETRENFLLSDGSGDYPWTSEPLEEGVWTVTVTAEDSRGNAVSHTFDWRYAAGTALPGRSVIWYAPAEPDLPEEGPEE